MEALKSRFRLSDLSPATPLRDSTAKTNNSTPLNPSQSSLAQSIFTTPAPLHLSHTRPPKSTLRSKRKIADENAPPHDEETPTKKRDYRPRRSKAQKLESICDAITASNWSLGDFLYELFRTKDDTGELMNRTSKQAMFSTNFLQGRTTYTPGMIVELWFEGPDGRVPVKFGV